VSRRAPRLRSRTPAADKLPPYPVGWWLRPPRRRAWTPFAHLL